MIKLTKLPEPDILAKNAVQWLADLKSEIAKGGDKISYRQSKYNQLQIKSTLRKETKEKCAYCEAFHLHVSYGDIEHIVPKSSDVDATFIWSNLTLACKICNTNKNDKDGLIDPYSDEPENEFYFSGPWMWHKQGHVAAEITRSELKLNRGALMERRGEKLGEIHNQMERIQAAVDPAKRDALKTTIINALTEDAAEFAACARSEIQRLNSDGKI